MSTDGRTHADRAVEERERHQLWEAVKSRSIECSLQDSSISSAGPKY
jgi:hypothetical protein